MEAIIYEMFRVGCSKEYIVDELQITMEVCEKFYREYVNISDGHGYWNKGF